MKYIRTKDGKIIDTDRYLIGSGINKDYLTFYDNLKIKDFELHKDEMLEEADTIEELCDEFVCKRKNNALNITPCLFNQDYDFDKEKEKLKIKFEIYGAIWTDNGLIYVAKMNEEGVLCLI